MTSIATSIKLETEQKKRLERLAESRERSPHWLMKQAIDQYLDREEEHETLRRELEQRRRRYEETGLHLTGDEVDDWINARLRGESPPRLKPHR